MRYLKWLNLIPLIMFFIVDQLIAPPICSLAPLRGMLWKKVDNG